MRNMKRLVSLLCVCSMLLAIFALPIAAAAEDTLDKHLITHWDFEGEGDRALMDKSINGNHNNTMTLVGKAAAQNGTVVIPDANGSGIYAADDETGSLATGLNSDLMRNNESRTIYIRFQSDKTLANGDRIELASQNGAFRLGFNTDGSMFASTNPHSMNENSATTTDMTYTPNAWITAAISYDKSAGNGKMTITTYFKSGTGAWSSNTVAKTDASQTWVEDNSDSGAADSMGLLFGRLPQNNFNSTWGGKITIDDIRIYDKALDLGEVVSIQTQTPLSEYLLTHWDFEGTGAEGLTDKSNNGSASDTLTLYGASYLENGTAVIPNYSGKTVDGVVISNNSAIYAADSADLFRTPNSRTLFIRFQCDHKLFVETTADSNGFKDNLRLVSQTGAINLGVDNSNDKMYCSTNAGNLGENWALTDGMYYQPNTWITMAVAYDKSAGNGQFTIKTYFKADGGEWVQGTVSKTDAAQTWEQEDYSQNAIANSKFEHDALILGRQLASFSTASWGGTIKFDDVRIYGKALTAEEVASVAAEVTLDDALITHWDFEGSNPLADKANGAVQDTLISTDSTNQIIQNGTVTIKGTESSAVALYASDSADLLRTSESRTLAMRFRADTVDQLMELVGQNSALRVFHQANGSSLNATLSPDSMGDAIWTGGDFTFQADTWYTVIVVFDKDTSTTLNFIMYVIDGAGKVAVAQKRVTGINNNSFWMTDSSSNLKGKNELYIGRRYNGGGSSIGNLEIDDIRIYSRALAEDECVSVHEKMKGTASDTDFPAAKHSISLSGDIAVNFYLVPSPYFASKDNMSVSISNSKGMLLEAGFTNAYQTNALVGGYRYTAHIAAKEMADPLTLTVKRGDTVYYTETYSALTYAEVLLANPTKYANELPLVKAMLNYGGYAQSYWNYHTDRLANAGLNLALGDVNLDDSHKATVSGDTVSGVSVKATLKLEGKTQVVFTVTFDENVNLAGYKINGQVPTSRTVTVFSQGVNAQSMDQKQQLVISCGASTQYIYYAPTTYIRNQVNKGNAELTNLVKAMYAYHEAAKLYNGAQSVQNFGNITYTAGAGLLYNGIKLPSNWPPKNVDPLTDAVVTPPYLLSSSQGGYRPDVIDVTVGRQLFVDNFLISSTNLTTVYHQAQKYGSSPIYQESGNVGTSAGGIWYDMQEKKYKMWYDVGFNPGLGYAESTDGIHWTPVNAAGTNSNIVMGADQKNGTCSVFIDYTAHPTEKYKMLVQRLSDDNEVSGLGTHDRLPGDLDEHSYLHTLYVSPDGIHWTQKGDTSIGSSGDMTSAFYNAFTNKWVNSLRGYARTYYQGNYYTGRARWYAEHDSFEDLLSWTAEEAVFWQKCDKNDPMDPSLGCAPQLYNFGAIAYESIMLGSFTIWRGPENDVVESTGTPKKNEIQMAYSRDGFYFDRPDRNAFIGVGADGEWDKGYLFSTVGGIIVQDDLLYIYYSGFSGYDGAGNKNGHATQSIGLATLRRDGFASLEGKGSIETRKLTVNEGKKYLFVNIDVPENSFAVSIVGPDGNVYEGFSMADCVVVGGDSTCKQITWKNGQDLSFLNGTEFQLRFSLNDGGAFYSFWFSDSLTGESGGAVAAGYAGN